MTMLFDEGPTEIARVTPEDVESDDRIVSQFSRDRSKQGSALSHQVHSQSQVQDLCPQRGRIPPLLFGEDGASFSRRRVPTATKALARGDSSEFLALSRCFGSQVAFDFREIGTVSSMSATGLGFQIPYPNQRRPKMCA